MSRMTNDEALMTINDYWLNPKASHGHPGLAILSSLCLVLPWSLVLSHSSLVVQTLACSRVFSGELSLHRLTTPGRISKTDSISSRVV